MNRTALIAGGASLVSAAAGVAAGYFVAVKRTKASFEEELKAQMTAAEKLFKLKYKVGMYASPEEMLKERRVPAGQVTQEQADAAHVAYGQVSDLDEEGLERILAGLRREDVAPPAEPISGSPTKPDESLLGLDAGYDVDMIDRSVFGDEEEVKQPNYERWIEENPRGPEAPYIITNAEYHHGDAGHDTANLTWFDENGEEGMGVLVDDKDLPIDDVDMVVGWNNMERFGMWSGQHNVVYIRNEKLEMDFEVIRMRGSYAEAMGLRTPPTRRVPRPRRGADE